MSTEEALPPNFGKLETALRSIGYSFPVAVADVMDNSIDAGCTRVVVRLMMREDGGFDLVIWDNGCGMSPKTLKEALRFGSDVTTDMNRLGKFGLGLKLASLSQAREVRVLSMRDGKVSARGWLEHGVRAGFVSTVFEPGEARAMLARLGAGLAWKTSGTAVWWSRLYRQGRSSKGQEEHAQQLLRLLDAHLALAFHRYLGGTPRKVELRLDILDMRSGEVGLADPVRPLNPFGYPHSGRTGYPLPLQLEGTYKSLVRMKAHIWPPNSDAPEYKLPGGANARQGFYFYRNNRLIQAGGWSGLREAEPHASLARIEVDLSPELDVEVSLDVKKIQLHLPADLANAFKHAKGAGGIDFKQYTAAADEVYRKRAITRDELPLIPTTGLPAPLVAFLREELRLERTARYRKVTIRWRDLPGDVFFDFDRDADSLFLNKRFRKSLLHGRAATAADIPVLKSLLFLLLQDTLASERIGPRMRERIDVANRILVRAVRCEQRRR